MKHVAGPEAAGEVAMFERMIQMVAGVVLSCVVPDPLAVMLDVGRVRMSRLVLEVSLGGSLARSWGFVWRRSRVRRRRRMHGRRATRRYISATDSTPAATILTVLLGVPRNRGYQKYAYRYE